MNKKLAIRQAFLRIGLQVRPNEVVHALAEQGIDVAEEFVRQVKFEMLKQTTRPARLPEPVRTRMIRRPQGFPGK